MLADGWIAVGLGGGGCCGGFGCVETTFAKGKKRGEAKPFTIVQNI